jgi:SAM-dependent methyltransferase
MSDWSRERILEKYRKVADVGKPYTWFNYQPINLSGYEETLSLCGRACFDRSQAVTRHLNSVFENRTLSIIDWGCNLGFFCFELAKLGHRVVGIDNNPTHVEICRYLARTHDFPVRPQFFCDEISADSIANHQSHDVALCFSVLHHLKGKKIPTLAEFASAYPRAYLEMDGSGYGFHTLYAFYWTLEEVVETNDPYGTGRRKRKTWYCSNRFNGISYRNIKRRNIVGSRGVFTANRDNKTSVIKRELKAKKTHTWVDTDLLHERKMYQLYEGIRYFPTLIDYETTDDCHWIELELVQNDESFSENELEKFYRFLRDNKLFILDLTSDSFLFRDGRLKVVDLETMFPIESSLEDLIRSRTKRSRLPFPSYADQLEHLVKRLNPSRK